MRIRSLLFIVLLCLSAQPAHADYNPGAVQTVSTIAQLRTGRFSGIASLFLSGWTSPGDGGQGLLVYVPGSAAADDGCTIFKDAAGNRFMRSDVTTELHTGQCGAVGRGTSVDVTANLQNAYAWFRTMSALCLGPKLVYDRGTGVYAINGTLEWPPGVVSPACTPQSDIDQNYQELWETGTNLPINEVTIAASATAAYIKYENFIDVYSTAQSTLNTESAIVGINCTGNTGQGFHNFFFENGVIANAYHGFAQDYAHVLNPAGPLYSCPVWEYHLDRIFGGGNLSGADVRFSCNGCGNNNEWLTQNYYQRNVQVEPAIWLGISSGLHIDECEINGGDGTAIELDTDFNVEMDSCHFEIYTENTDNEAVLLLNGGVYDVRSMFFGGFSSTAPDQVYLVKCNSCTLNAGTFWAANQGSVTGTVYGFLTSGTGSHIQFTGGWGTSLASSVKFDGPTSFAGGFAGNYSDIDFGAPVSFATGCTNATGLSTTEAIVAVAPGTTACGTPATGITASYTLLVNGYVSRIITNIDSAPSGGSVEVKTYQNGVLLNDCTIPAAQTKCGGPGVPFTATYKVSAGDIFVVKAKDSAGTTFTGSPNILQTVVIGQIGG